MKKIFLVGLMILFVASSVTLLYADAGMSKTKVTAKDITTKPYRLEVGDKAARGVNNVLFGWTELPKRVVDITKETNNPIWGLLAGTFQGTLKAMARTASGVVDVVTAPISPDKAPLMQPDISVE